MVAFEIPIRISSKTNQRVHWSKRHKIAAEERRITALCWAGNPGKWQPTLPCRVTLIRIAPKELDDDNLRGAFKAIRDEIAKIIGVDDKDPRVEWDYGQEKGPVPRYYSTRVMIEEILPGRDHQGRTYGQPERSGHQCGVCGKSDFSSPEAVRDHQDQDGCKALSRRKGPTLNQRRKGDQHCLYRNCQKTRLKASEFCEAHQ